MKRIAPMMFRLFGVFALISVVTPLAAPAHAGVTDAENANSVVSAETAEAKLAVMGGEQAKLCNQAEKKLAEEKAKGKMKNPELEQQMDFYCKQSFTSEHARNETATDSDVQTLDTTQTASIPGGAGSNLLSGQSLGGSAPASDGFKLAEVKVDNSAVSGEAVSKLTNGDSYGVYNDSTLKSSVTGANTATTNVTSVKVDDKALDARYDPAKVVIGGSGTGMVRCSGKSAACPGGKWAVDTNDGSRFVSLNEGRTRTLKPGEWFQTEDNGVTQGYLVNSSMPKGTTSAMVQTADMIRSLGEGMGANETVIATAIADVYRESKFNTATGPRTSSAWNYGQYVGNTWLSAAKTDNGVILNRNNSFDAATVLLKDVNNRYTNYTNSSIQNRMTFGEYDYAIHHDGSIINGGAGNTFAINYYRNTAGAGNSIANYVLGGNYTGNVVAGGNVRNIFGNGTTTGNGSVDNVISALSRGDVSGALSSLLGSSAGNGNSALQLLAQAFQGGGSSSSGSGSDSSGSSTGGSGSGGTGTDSSTKTVKSKEVLVGMDETLTVTRYSDGSVVTEVVKNTDAAAFASASSILSRVCGGSQTTSRDAFMLMVNQCAATLSAGV